MDHLKIIQKQYDAYGTPSVYLLLYDTYNIRCWICAGFIEAATTPEEQTLLAFTIHVDSFQRYESALVVGREGVKLYVEETKGIQRRKIFVPSEFMAELEEALAELLENIAITTKGKPNSKPNPKPKP